MLYDRLAVMGGQAASEALAMLRDGTATRTPQVYGPQYQYASMLSREMSPLDWEKPAQVLVNQIRGLIPWPCATTDVIHGQSMKIYDVEEIGDSSDAVPGTIVATGKKGIDIVCGDGKLLRIVELQAQGSKRMAAAAYLLGHPIQL